MSPSSSSSNVLRQTKTEPQQMTSALGRRRRKPQTPATVRRNERERNRVRHVNACFSRLRQFVAAVGPNGTRRHASSTNKRLSKVDTLRAAISYIRQLQTMLHQDGDDADRFAPHNYPQVTIVDLVEPSSPSLSSNSGNNRRCQKNASKLRPIKEAHFSSEDDRDPENDSSPCSDLSTTVISGSSVGSNLAPNNNFPGNNFTAFQLTGTLSPCNSSNFSYCGSTKTPSYSNNLVTSPKTMSPIFSSPAGHQQQAAYLQQTCCAYSPPNNNNNSQYHQNNMIAKNNNFYQPPSPVSSNSPTQFQGIPLTYAVYPPAQSYYSGAYPTSTSQLPPICNNNNTNSALNYYWQQTANYCR